MGYVCADGHTYPAIVSGLNENGTVDVKYTKLDREDKDLDRDFIVAPFVMPPEVVEDIIRSTDTSKAKTEQLEGLRAERLELLRTLQKDAAEQQEGGKQTQRRGLCTRPPIRFVSLGANQWQPGRARYEIPAGKKFVDDLRRSDGSVYVPEAWA